MQKKLIFNAKIGGKFKQVDFANRQHTVVSALTIEGDTVMNRIFYPQEVVKNAFTQLNNLPAPAGHPTFNGEPLDPNSPVARNQFDIGAFVKDPFMDGKRVFNNIFIDEVRAGESDKGQAILEKVRNGETLGVSTGGTADLTRQEGEDFDFVVTNLNFDHVAILDGEDPAGSNTFIQNSDCQVIDLDNDEIKHISNSSTTQEEDSMADLKSEDVINAVVQSRICNASAEDLKGLPADKLVAAIANSVEKEVTFDQALEVIEAKGKRVTNHSKEDLEAFDAYQAKQVEIRNAKIEEILKTDAAFEREELESMKDETLEKIQNSFTKQADYSGQSKASESKDKIDLTQFGDKI